MNDRSRHLGRRVWQFMRHIGLMDFRRHELATGDCFLVFSDKDSAGEDGKSLQVANRLRVPAYAPLVVGRGRDCWGLGWASPSGSPADGGDDLSSMGDSGESWSGEGTGRFVQFLFADKWVAMDLPNTTIFPPEVRRLLRERSGFFRNADVPDYRITSSRYIEKFDPTCKYYIYGDESTAAEDTAFIFFDLWHFPCDSRLYAKACAFKPGPSFGPDIPLG